MSARTVESSVPAVREDVGELHTHQAIATAMRGAIDPFLMLAHHGPQVYPANNRGLPFGPHPHRGFETVTFIRKGALAHHDSGGHESVMEDGGVQWMTAGAGVVHAEVSPPSFRRDGGEIEILQLWINLPGRLKMSPPRYVGLQARAVPQIELSDGAGRMSLVSGHFDGVDGPIASPTGVLISTIELEAGANVRLPAPAGRNVLLYVIDGNVLVGGSHVSGRHLVTLSEGDSVEISATERSSLLFGHADPLGEPVVAGGPFIMNSEAEVEQAFKDYREGKFDGVPMSIDLGR